MHPKQLIAFLSAVEKLKCNTRHSWTSTGRQESVAEHCWRTAVMALLAADEFPGVDIEKVVKMCLIHDFGEAVTGDIPAFIKTKGDEERENAAVSDLLGTLPMGTADGFAELFEEMAGLATPEARLFKALDQLEALISHNEAPLDTLLEREYTENLTYGAESAAYSPYLTELREEINRQAIRKMEGGK